MVPNLSLSVLWKHLSKRVLTLFNPIQLYTQPLATVRTEDVDLISPDQTERKVIALLMAYIHAALLRAGAAKAWPTVKPISIGITAQVNVIPIPSSFYLCPFLHSIIHSFIHSPIHLSTPPQSPHSFIHCCYRRINLDYFLPPVNKQCESLMLVTICQQDPYPWPR